MGKKIGYIFITLGMICLLCAAGLMTYNFVEEKKSEQSVSSLLNQAKEQIGNIDGLEMIDVEGYKSIGILEIPVLNLEFPVLNDWTYEKLKKAPCLYYGSYNDKNFVIAAHNYQSHFGRLNELKEKDVIIFTDVEGTKHYYEVVLIETLSKYATLEMVTSGFDLSLYTCTLSGSHRVTVRCDKVK